MYNNKLISTIPLDQIEDSAIQQIETVCNYDEVKQLVIFPDCHAGYELPIGSLAVVKDHVNPMFVGYDIGCGVFHENLFDISDFLNEYPLSTLNKLLQKIYDKLQEEIPFGVGVGNKKNIEYDIDYYVMNEDLNYITEDKIREEIVYTFLSQMGSLGAGNHFLQVGINKKNILSITIHTGSRGGGYKLADYFIKKSKNSFIPINSELGQQYVEAQEYSMHKAEHNRFLLSIKAVRIIKTIFKSYINDRTCNFSNMLDVSHNFLKIYDDIDLAIHHKGSIALNKNNPNQLYPIPANQKDGVYLVKCKDFELAKQYMYGASHGAGRVMSRGQAKKVFTEDMLKEEMSGIFARTDTLDEAPKAYKDINTVLSNQPYLDVVEHHKPLIVIKG